jgi:Protein of unknwon function (DUF3310)
VTSTWPHCNTCMYSPIYCATSCQAEDKVVRAEPEEVYISRMKYREDEMTREVLQHIEETYGKHYVADDEVQSLDMIFASGHGTGFCVGNAMKYLARYGKKNGHDRADLLKAAHYIVLQLYIHSKENK